MLIRLANTEVIVYCFTEKIDSLVISQNWILFEAFGDVVFSHYDYNVPYILYTVTVFDS